MPRVLGSRNVGERWTCKAIVGDTILLNKEFATLRDIATELDMKYCKVYELTDKGRKKHKHSTSRYVTNIYITKLELGKMPEEVKV